MQKIKRALYLSEMSGSGLSWWLCGQESTAKADDGVPSLIQEDPMCPGATNPMCHSYQACVLEPGATATEPMTSGVPGPHNPRSTAEKPSPRSPHISRQEPHRTAATGSPGAATKTQNSQRWVNKQKLSKNICIRNDRERQCSCSVIKNSKKKRKLNPMHNNSGCNLNQRESKF